ncbi:MAG: phenylalanine--tRNA ligase subunit alpha, partial [Candidatus Sulfotelmatobacter sp.]
MTILESAKIVAYSVPKLTDYSAAALDEAVEELLSASDQEWQAVRNESDWKALRDRWMARKNGVLTLVNDLWLKPAPREAKRDVGQRVNRIREQVEKDIERGRGLSKNYPILAQYFSSPAVDITLPGIRHPIGAEHPVVKTTNEMVRVFQRLGYSVADGPVVETDYYNFEALNFPPNHPARDTQDTLFIAGQQGKAQRERLLLRTHTSPVQIRTMEKMRPPIRIVIPGTVHRNDPPDASHSPMFHQIEGLAVDTNITFGDLKGTLDH